MSTNSHITDETRAALTHELPVGGSCAVHVNDFSQSTRDPFRDRWTLGKLRHVVAAFRGQVVAVTTDARTGHTVFGYLEAVAETGYSNPGARLMIRSLVPGAGVTAYLIASLGPVLIPVTPDVPGAPKGGKWAALDSYREEQSSARALAAAALRDQYGIAADADLPRGQWSLHQGIYDVDVHFTPDEPGTVSRFWSHRVRLEDCHDETRRRFEGRIVAAPIPA